MLKRENQKVFSKTIKHSIDTFYEGWQEFNTCHPFFVLARTCLNSDMKSYAITMKFPQTSVAQKLFVTKSSENIAPMVPL